MCIHACLHAPLCACTQIPMETRRKVSILASPISLDYVRSLKQQIILGDGFMGKMLLHKH